MQIDLNPAEVRILMTATYQLLDNEIKRFPETIRKMKEDNRPQIEIEEYYTSRRRYLNRMRRLSDRLYEELYKPQTK